MKNKLLALVSGFSQPCLIQHRSVGVEDVSSEWGIGKDIINGVIRDHTEFVCRTFVNYYTSVCAIIFRIPHEEGKSLGYLTEFRFQLRKDVVLDCVRTYIQQT